MAERVTSILVASINYSQAEQQMSKEEKRYLISKDDGIKHTGKLKLLHLNISGTKFTISEYLIEKFPKGRLSQLQSDCSNYLEDGDEYYFDRNPHLFGLVLDIYRYETVSVPESISWDMLIAELEFWNVDVAVLKVNSDSDNERDRLDKEFDLLEDRTPPPESASVTTRRLYDIWWFLTDPHGPYTKYKRLSLFTAGFCNTMIMTFLVAFGFTTSLKYRHLPDQHSWNTRKYLYSREQGLNDSETWRDNCKTKLQCYTVSLPNYPVGMFVLAMSILLSLEGIVRFIVCPRKRHYTKSFVNWAEFIAILATFAAILMPLLHSFSINVQNLAYMESIIHSMQVLRVFRIFQYTALSDGLTVVVLTIKASSREIFVLGAYLCIGMIIFSTLIMFVELQQEMGRGIPDCIYGYWWTLITMTSVGYGDFYPETAVGYIVGGLCAITGLVITALPVAVIGSNFNMYWQHNKWRTQGKKAKKDHFSKGRSLRLRHCSDNQLSEQTETL